ncbi:hypothetical protein CHM34_18525 [Paludifilum halophilum]|uniref:Uncharacterized protein n=1 Tax=Paludifilum halophilum TaxID=1642702 RepID=A0A235B2B0_9BACL|nr:hypothetical protein CHM34_18525 [Paludifilum halophilum]
MFLCLFLYFFLLSIFLFFFLLLFFFFLFFFSLLLFFFFFFFFKKIFNLFVQVLLCFVCSLYNIFHFVLENEECPIFRCKLGIVPFDCFFYLLLSQIRQYAC